MKIIFLIHRMFYGSFRSLGSWCHPELAICADTELYNSTRALELRCMNTNDCMRFYVVVCGCMWLYVVVCGCMWLYAVSCEFVPTL